MLLIIPIFRLHFYIFNFFGPQFVTSLHSDLIAICKDIILIIRNSE